MTMVLDVYRLVVDMGQTVTLRRVSQGAYNTATSTFTVTNTDVSVTALFLSYKDRQMDGSQILKGDRKIIIYASGVTVPQADDLVILGTDQYRLIDVSVINEAGDNLVYICQGRKQ